MPSTFIAVPEYPDVPNEPGVPPINRDPSAPIPGPPPALTGDGVGVSANGGAPIQWGIYETTGVALLTGDTTFDMQYRREYRVSDYPVEQGAFASYNKVQLPYVARMTFLKGGSVEEKSEFLNDCENLVASLELNNLVTPEVTYPNINATAYDYDRRAAKGVGLMYVEIMFEEIRVAPPAAFTSTTSPTAADPANTGTVQAQPPTAREGQFGLTWT